MSTLLCVEDDPQVLQLLRDHFSLQGFGVVTATTGIEAFLQAVRWVPRAVVLDLFIPRLGGLGVLERIRRLHPGIVAVLISGVPNAVEMLAEAGVRVAGAFTKPVDLDRISRALARAGVAPARSGGPGQPLRSSIRIRALVVDDEPEIRRLLTDYLEERGLEVLEAWDGEDALRRLPDFRPHLILLDILLPGLSGVETLRRMRPLLQETCVIVISGHEDVETARRALEMGAVEYLQKPVDLRALDALLGLR